MADSAQSNFQADSPHHGGSFVNVSDLRDIFPESQSAPVVGSAVNKQRHKRLVNLEGVPYLSHSRVRSAAGAVAGEAAAAEPSGIP